MSRIEKVGRLAVGRAPPLFLVLFQQGGELSDEIGVILEHVNFFTDIVFEVIQLNRR